MVGRTLGQYLVVESIGAGGMGEVYRARDTRLERDVALKVVSARVLDSEPAQRRLRKEALALSRLNHPNIAVVHDFNIVDGVAFVAMELVPGIDLRDRLASGPLPERDVIDFGAQAAAALDAAHAAGVVHRDLKPANLRVTADGRLKVLDFGIAERTVLANDAPLMATETAPARAVGTAPYMAPEQLRGEPADPRSDIYSLAVTLYEMATGRRPFDAPTDAVLIDQILNEAPVPPLDRNPRLSPGLDAIIVKGLEKDPGRRYQSVREMLVDLERLRTPSTSRPPAGAPRPRRRSLARWTATLAPVVVVAAVLGWMAWRGWPGPALSFAARDWIVVADFDNQTGETVFDTSLATAFAISLGQSAHANLVPRARIDAALARMGRTDSPRIEVALAREIAQRESARGVLAPGISRIGQQYALSATLVDPQSGVEVRSYAERAGDANGILDALSRIADAVRRDLGESLSSIRGQSQPLPQVTTASLEALQSQADGNELWRRGRYREAVVHFRRAAEIDPDFAMAHAALGNAYLSFIFNDDERGRQHMDRALALAGRVTERERLLLQARYQHLLGDRLSAINLYQAFLYRYPDDTAVRSNLAGLFRDLGRLDPAAAEYREVIRIAPTDASALINLATTELQADRVTAALQAYERAFVIEPEWRATGNLNHEYGFALVRAGRQSDAEALFALKLGVAEERPGGLRSLALLDLYHGRYRAAETRLDEAVRLNQSLKRTLSAGRDLGYLAILREGRGDRSGQIAFIDRALAEFDRANDFSFSIRLGVMAARLGQIDKARRILATAEERSKAAQPAARADLTRLRGEILVAVGQFAPGIEALRAYSLEEGVLPALAQTSLGHAFERAGQRDDAIRAYEAFDEHNALSWEPQQSWLQSRYQLASLYRQRGDRDKAVAVLDRLLELWREADPDLPLLGAARKLRQELGR
jgi:tetratricopeptide (TPR) repeat protein